MLRRIFISLIILAALAFLLVPLGIGFVLDRAYPQVVTRMSQAWGNGEVEFERIDRGWFTSTAEGVLLMPGQAPVRWSDVIAHGPIPWGAADRTPAWLAGRMTMQPPSPQFDGHLAYRANLDTSLELTLDLESGRSPDGLASGPLLLKAEAPTDGSRFEVELHSDALTLPLSSVANTAIDGMFSRADSGFWSGALNLKIARADLKDQQVTQLQGLNLELSTAAESGSATIEANLSADLAATTSINYTEAKGQLILSKLDELAVGRLFKQLARGGDATARNAAFFGELIAQAPILVSTRPQLRVSNASIVTDFGPASGAADLTLVDPDPRLLTEPIYLLAYLSGKIEMEMPRLLARAWVRERVLQEAPEMAASEEVIEIAVNDTYDELVSDGVLIQRGQMVSAIIEFRDGGAIVNGKAIPLPRPPAL